MKRLLKQLKTEYPLMFTNTKKFRDLLPELKLNTNFLDETASNAERVYCVLNDITEIQLCRGCKSPVKFEAASRGYRSFCSKRCVSTAEEVLSKKRKTCLERYGVEHPSHSEEIFNMKMSAYSRKDFLLPSGKVVKVQGYEPEILSGLLQTFEEDDIICGVGVPDIYYKFEGKRRRYHPDIYIKSRNMIVEVKSLYTYEVSKNQNIAKMDACVLLGYNFWFTIGK